MEASADVNKNNIYKALVISHFLGIELLATFHWLIYVSG